MVEIVQQEAEKLRITSNTYEMCWLSLSFVYDRTGGHTCVPDSQLQAAAILGEPVGFGAGGGGHGGHRPGGTLPGNLDRRPQQVNLLPVHVLHIVLHNGIIWNVRELGNTPEKNRGKEKQLEGMGSFGDLRWDPAVLFESTYFHARPSVEGADPSQQTSTSPGIVEAKQIKTRFNFHPH